MGRIETLRSSSPARQFALIHRDRWLSQVEAILAPADFSKSRPAKRASWKNSRDCVNAGFQKVCSTFE